MLVLNRKEAERVAIGDPLIGEIILTVCEIKGGRVSLGIQAPPGILIRRLAAPTEQELEAMAAAGRDEAEEKRISNIERRANAEELNGL